MAHMAPSDDSVSGGQSWVLLTVSPKRRESCWSALVRVSTPVPAALCDVTHASKLVWHGLEL